MKNIVHGILSISVLAASACGNGGSSTCANPQVLTNADVNGNVVLDGCYAADNVLTVSEGTLELSPGTSITFASEAGIHVEGGALSSLGTEDEPVLLTGDLPERGSWMGVAFDSGSADNILEHTIIEYGGIDTWHGGAYSRAGVTLLGDDTRAVVRDTLIRESGQTGISATEAGSVLTVEGATFEDNDSPMWLAANAVGGLSDLTFSGNDDEQIVVAYRDAGPLDVAQTWAAQGVPYRVNTTVSVRAPLTIDAGVELVFAQDEGLDIGEEGQLTVEGTEAAPVVMRGVEALSGYWKGLYFHDTRSTGNDLDFLVLEDGGSSEWHGGAASKAGIYVEQDGVQLNIANSTFRNNAQAAVVADGGLSTLTISGSLFEGNDLPLWIQANHAAGLAADNAFMNEDAILIGVSRSRVTADQLWNAFTVPYRVANTVIVEAQLTLSPGTTIEFQQDEGLDVDTGTLIADADGNDAITFTSAEQGVTGYWRGIRFVSTRSADNIIANAEVMNAGSSGWHGGASSKAAIFVSGTPDTASVKLQDVHVEGSGSHGLSVEDGGEVSACGGLTFASNAGDDMAGPLDLSACIQ